MALRVLIVLIVLPCFKWFEPATVLVILLDDV